MKVSEAYAKIAELASVLGVKRINELPGCWEHQIDALWWFAINGHDGPMAHSGGEAPIDSFDVYVKFNGWPAGVLGPGGGIIAAGAAANEDAFIAAIDAAIQRVSP